MLPLLSDIFVSILDGAVDYLQKRVKYKTEYVVAELLDNAQTYSKLLKSALLRQLAMILWSIKQNAFEL